MILEGRVYCEGPGCEHNAHIGAPSMALGRLPVGWLKVKEYSEGDDYTSAFCGMDCVMKWAAKAPPSEVFPFDQEGE